MASKRDNFIDLVEKVFANANVENLIKNDENLQNGFEYWNEFKCGRPSQGGVTDTGMEILKAMTAADSYSAKELGGILSKTGRSISGSMKKLCSDGYCEKYSANPVRYKLTESGKKLTIDFK